MNYLVNHLPSGEKVVATTRKSAFVFVREFFILIILGGIIAGFLYGLKWDAGKMLYVYISCGVIFLIFFINNLIKFVSTALLVSTNKFLFKKDLVSITFFQTQLQNIDGIEVKYKTPLQRLFNAGSITVLTRNAKYELKYIKKPDIFAARLNKQASNVAGHRITFGIGPQRMPNSMAIVKKSPDVVAKKVKKKTA